MAKLRSSSSQISQFSNPSSCPSLFFVSILIIFIFLITLLQSSTSMAVRSVPFEPTTSNSNDKPSRTSSTTTMDFDHHHHPKRTHHDQSHSKPRRSFEAGAHEVPSGPNPISNR
ncbi:hypothetical protein OSB04_023162 [Centaurea solstitialis]|uniref:Uncharacterized protein n=1 Tax=Centaurea solstitialis TaxID=347529 RepID=A0AA38W953_9ASTR|nr:hypothetical protein OSB04_023162 [Centaurea solstitialis]